MWTRAALLFAVIPSLAGAQDPLSAIDWLNRQNNAPQATQNSDSPQATAVEPPVSSPVPDPVITVAPLEAPIIDGAGLLPSSVTGFPVDLWGPSSAEAVAALLAELDPATSPAMQSLLLPLLLAEATPPAATAPEGSFLHARLRKLVDLGAVEAGLELARTAGPAHRSIFDVYFDLSLLAGEETEACRVLIANPHLLDAFAPRIFCLARLGQWETAAVTLHSALSIGALDRETGDRLALFLSPELAEEIAPSFPAAPSPLDAQIARALGMPLNAAELPAAFAFRDLDGSSGWKAQIEAAERLVSRGVLDPTRLHAIYSEGKPSASGGVWDRVSAVQALDAALAGDDPAKIGAALRALWRSMARARLLVPMAAVYGETLLSREISADQRELAMTVLLLSPEYERAAEEEDVASLSFARAIAKGGASDIRATSAMERAVQEGLTSQPTPAFAALLASGRLGEALLRAMSRYLQALDGDLRAGSEALSLFRAVGLEDVTRRAALQLLLLPREA